jgi:hypothetical protein
MMKRKPKRVEHGPCRECDFWAFLDLNDYRGCCRRHAPIAVPIKHMGAFSREEVGTFYPITTAADTCGDWQSKTQ